MKYAIFDKQGFPKAFYDSEIHTDIPKDAIEISDEQWFEFINNQGKRKWDFAKNDVVVYEPPPPTPEELRDRIQKQLLNLEKQRVNEVCDQYGYIDLADVSIYANQGDSEANAILDWYSTYDDLIWNWIDQILPVTTDLQNVDVKAVEEDLYNQSIQESPLP